MKKIILLISIVNINNLETKFIRKTETFIKDCSSDLDTIEFEKLQSECKDEEYFENNCKNINGES